MKIWALLLGFVFFGCVAKGQTDVAASVYGAFTGTVNGNGVAQSPSNQAGFIAELHHQSNPLVGYEVSYSWNRANQKYVQSAATSTFTQIVPADAHEITAAWEVSLHVLNVRPFLLAGGGVIFHQPSGQTTIITNAGPGDVVATTKSDTAGVLVYGGGVDVGLLPHLGLRAQYRGNLYSAPQLSEAFSSTSAFFHTSEPMIGAYFRF